MRVAAGCAWQAQSDAPWLTITSGASGSGDGTISYAVAANPGLTQRVGRITATGDQDFTVTQLGIVCAVHGDAAGDGTSPCSGGSGTVHRPRRSPSARGRPRSVLPRLDHDHSTPRRHGPGVGRVYGRREPRSGRAAGVLTVAGREIPITQAAAPCVFTVTPPTTTAFPAAGGNGSATVATHSACAWTAASSVPWITITPPAGGTGNGTAAFTVAANPDPVVRNGTLTVAGREIAISQAAACVFTLTPSSPSVPFSGGTGSIGVATLAGCAWTAAVGANSPWLTITSGGSGSGPGTVQLSFAANTTAQQRTGTVTIGTATVTFTQAPTTLGSLTGAVTDSINGRPVAAATVTLVATPLTTATSNAGTYTFSNVQQGAYTILIQKAGFDDFRSPVTINAAQTTTLNVTLVARPVNLVMTWNPSTTDGSSGSCSQPPNPSLFCWRSNLTIRETSGTAAPLTSLTLHYYDSNGVFLRSVAGTFSPFTVPGNNELTVGAFTESPSPAGGQVEFELFGTDAFGRSFSFRSPKLVYNTVVVTVPIGTLRSGQPAGTGGILEGAGLPATRTIRRR